MAYTIVCGRHLGRIVTAVRPQLSSTWAHHAVRPLYLQPDKTRHQYPCGQLHMQHTREMATSTKKGKIFARKDKVEAGNILVYTNNFSSFLLSTYATVGLCTIPSVLTVIQHFCKDPQNIENMFSSIDDPAVLPLCASIFGVCLWISLRLLLSKMLLRIYYHEQTGLFTGLYMTTFLQKEKIKFISEDVKDKQCTGILGEMTGNITVREKPFYIQGKDFSSPRYLNLMKGLIKHESSET